MSSFAAFAAFFHTYRLMPALHRQCAEHPRKNRPYRRLSESDQLGPSSRAAARSLASALLSILVCISNWRASEIMLTS